MVIAYKMHWLSWLMMRGKRYQPWVGLPNILCQDFVVPEFLQSEAKPQILADETLAWLDQPKRTAEVIDRFNTLHADLLRDTENLAAADVANLLHPNE
jgi:lipid-A-disaccharide synthase